MKFAPAIFKTLFPAIVTSSKSESSQGTLEIVAAAVYASLYSEITSSASLLGGVAGASVGSGSEIIVLALGPRILST